MSESCLTDLLNPELIHPAANVFPLLPETELRKLADDIRQRGQLMPILRLNGKILDGRNRYIACQLAGIRPKYKDIVLDDFEAIGIVVSLNIRRRHLSKSQSAAAAIEALPLLEKAALERRLAPLKGRPRSNQLSVPQHEKGRSDTQAGRLFGVSGRYVATAKALKTKAPQLFASLQTGELTLQQAVRKERELKAKMRKNTPRTYNPAHDQVQVKCGDFRKIAQTIKPNTVDLILTDPPYAAEYLPLWQDLGKVATRILRPGGFLAAMSGLYHLPAVIAALSQDLNYYWTLCLRLTGSHGRRIDKGLCTSWRPILLFAKPPVAKPPEFFIDLIDSGGIDTSCHEWGQRQQCFDFLVQHFSNRGDLVFDPFSGGGTVLASCQSLGRRAIGAEIDAQSFRNCQNRLLHQAPQGSATD